MKFKEILLKVPKIIRTFLMQEINDDIKEIKVDNKQLHKELRENRLDIQKLAICSEELPISERVTIGKNYVANGGNGAVKVLVRVLEERYEEELKEERK